ncbi:MAG: ABC transporter ATP-binding protein, partial [Candidatus Eremiobacteraeota bacterium]|nr:ABC transporter ATP-binding protein [Candidatus Eremiobacteraeota bacterium]
ICLEVRAGELFGLLGANGAGKTTLLKILATLSIPDRGTITVAGVDARTNPMEVKRRIGLCVSEERSFYFRLTARQNLRFFGALVGLYGDLLEQRIAEVVALVDLTELIDRRFDTFSSGMRQRLSVARALLGDPDIIFFDEPTRAVDPMHAHEIRRMIRDVLVTQRGKTAVLATNSLEEAWSICDSVAILRDGRIIAHAPPKVLDAQFARFLRYHITLDNVDAAMLAKIQAMQGLRTVSSLQTVDGVSLNVELEPSGSAVDEMLRVLTANGAQIRSLRSEDPAPLDVFSGLTQLGDAR